MTNPVDAGDDKPVPNMPLLPNAATSPEEKRLIDNTREAVCAIPAVAGLLALGTMFALEWLSGLRIPDETLGLITLGGNAFLAGIIATVVVIRFHPVEHGKWWRAGLSSLFAFIMTFVFAFFWSIFIFCMVPSYE